MANAVLCRPIGFTSISAGGSTAGPTSNLANDNMGRCWQLSGGSGSVTVSFPSQLVDTVALLGTTALSGATWTVSVGGVSGDLWASPEAENCVHRNAFAHFAPTTTSSVTVSVSDGGADFAAARLVVGKSFQPADNIDFGWEFDVVDHGSNEIMPTGVEDDLVLAKVMRFRAAYGWLTEAEARTDLLKLMAYAGTTRPVLFCVDPEATDLHNVIGYGVLTESARARHIAVNGYTAGFELRSRLLLSL